MSAATFTITEPGAYPDMPESTYHADPVPAGSLSSGGARTLLEPGGPAKFHFRRGKEKHSAAFDLGKAVHTELLTKGAGIVEVDARDWRTKAAQDARTAARGAGLVPVLAEDYWRVRQMASAVESHPLAGPLLASDGPAEQSLFWTDPDTGVWCRARHDKAIRDRTGRLVIVDLKTCQNADEIAAAKSCGNYGYHQQDAWYRDAATALGLDDNPGFVFVFVEKDPPHLINVVQLATDDVAVGRRRNQAALRLYAECDRTGNWPGHQTGIAEISLPAYYPRQEY